MIDDNASHLDRPYSAARDPAPARSPADPYLSVLLLLLLASVAGVFAFIWVGRFLANKAPADAAISLAIGAGVLLGVIVARIERGRSSPRAAAAAEEVVRAEAAPAPTDEPSSLPNSDPEAEVPPRRFDSQWGIALRARALALELWELAKRWLRAQGPLGTISLVTAVGALIATLVVLRRPDWPAAPLRTLLAGGAGVCLAGAAMTATAARYFQDLDRLVLPEAQGLARAARVLSWILVFTALAVGLQAVGVDGGVRAIHWVVAAVNVSVCVALLRKRPQPQTQELVFPVELPVLSALGSRPNLVASVLDAAQRQLGIDLRSTWALNVLRQSVEPLLLSLALLFWLSTSLTVVSVQEQALVEHFGVPLSGPPLASGLHVRWPWPIDRVYRVPVGRVQTIEIGHEGPEIGGTGGPENVLWAVQHAPNEFTLLLGDGRDLITVDAALHYRVVDPQAWRYRSSNPEVALTAMGYRAVMRNTINKTLSDALSENVALLTDHIRHQVQQEADSLGLGVAIVGFTVRGMHPPVAVARSYQAVVSAQISKVTRIVNAQVFRNRMVPAVQVDVLNRINGARSQGALDLARAAGEAWSFRTLETQYRAAPADYVFRRRLEALEQDLPNRSFTILDARFQRDGGEVWVAP